MVIVGTDNDFNMHLNTAPFVVVKYHAKWCGMCRLISHKFKKISDAEEFSRFLFLDINVEENPQARKLAGVSGLPYFAIFKNGQLVDGVATAKEDVMETLIQRLK